MSSENHKILSRECQATMIPVGDHVNLPAGTKVTITHRLGGNFTVTSDYGMFRIQGKDADAIGEPIPAEVPQEEESTPENHDGSVDEEALWSALKKVFDPEIPVNIVDIGLIYSLQTTPLETGGNHVLVHMTLTAPGCGMGPVIAEDAKNQLLAVNGIKDATVDIVWDPPWNQDMISEEGKMQLGLI